MLTFCLLVYQLVDNVCGDGMQLYAIDKKAGYQGSVRLLELTLLVSALVLSGCGGSGEPAPTAPPPVIVTPTNPTPAPTPQPEECKNQVYTIIGANDDDNFELGFSPANAIDGDTSSASRWSSDGSSQALELDLGNIVTVGALTIKWFQGASRHAYF